MRLSPSILTWTVKVVQTRFTVSPIVEEKKFHFGIIKSHLTPQLDLKVHDILDEIALAFGDEIGHPAGES